MPTGALLGCGEPSAYLTAVGGGTRLAVLNLSGLSYSRRLGDISTSRIELAADQEAACANFLSTLEAYQFEASVYRDESEAWVGPVLEPTYTYNGMSISARDVFSFMERRLHPVDRSLTADLSVIAAQYIQDGIDLDPSPNIQTQVNLTGIVGTREVVALQFGRIADSIRELGRTGMDWYVVGRQIVLGPETTAPPILNLTEDNFEVDSARLAGIDMANEIFVLGATIEGVNTPLYGHAGGVDRPLVQQVYNDPTILDVNSATAAAEKRWQLFNASPIYVTGKLLESAAISFDALVPGVRMRLRQQVGFRAFDIVLRLVAVDVDYSFSDTGVTEDVKLTLQPLGTVEGL